MEVIQLLLFLCSLPYGFGCRASSMESTTIVMSDSSDSPINTNVELSEEHMVQEHQHQHFTESVLTPGVTYDDVTDEPKEHDGHLDRDKRSRNTVPTAEKFAKLIHLVKTSKLEDCAGRSVCELNCHPEAFGSDGKRVLGTLAKLQSSGYIQQPDMEFYVKAGLLGKKAYKTKTCKTSCSKTYPNCPAEAKDLVAVASLIRLSSWSHYCETFDNLNVWFYSTAFFIVWSLPWSASCPVKRDCQ